jgi:signal transduction histidine kinase
MFIRFLNRRLQPILDACDREILTENREVKHRDELDRLSTAFFSLLNQQNGLMSQLQQTNEQLFRATQLKDEFLANMSHELRTPLTAILGMTESLQDEVFGVINEKQQSALKIVEGSGNHLLELINDILDLAKIEAGELKLYYQPTTISQLCQFSMSFVQAQAAKKNLQLQIEIPPTLPNWMLDERRIRQALINLLNNAVKFTPAGGSITLAVTLQPPDRLRFAVIDTGIGIAPDDLNILFQPFIQVDTALTRQYEGTGLGLSLVQRIVELHGGSVGVSSQVGVGSQFTIDLPYKDLPIASSGSNELQSLIT